MPFVLTTGTDDEDATEFAYVACAYYACVANENQALLSTLGVIEVCQDFRNFLMPKFPLSMIDAL